MLHSPLTTQVPPLPRVNHTDHDTHIACCICGFAHGKAYLNRSPGYLWHLQSLSIVTALVHSLLLSDAGKITAYLVDLFWEVGSLPEHPP